MSIRKDSMSPACNQYRNMDQTSWLEFKSGICLFLVYRNLPENAPHNPFGVRPTDLTIFDRAAFRTLGGGGTRISVIFVARWDNRADARNHCQQRTKQSPITILLYFLSPFFAGSRDNRRTKKSATNGNHNDVHQKKTNSPPHVIRNA